MKLLLYCTKAKPLLRKNIKNQYYCDNHSMNYYINRNIDAWSSLNGKIVGECDFEVEEIKLIETPEYAGVECNTFVYDVSKNFETKTLSEVKLCERSCLNDIELVNYLLDNCLRDKLGYAIHIKNLVIYDKPKELSEYYSIQLLGNMLFTNKLKKAPQNMQRISVREWEYGTYSEEDINVLISIRPEWLCKILNGEKTIEVRKKVLKEMI